MVLWRAPHTTVKIDDAASITISTSAALDTFFSSSTAIATYMKNVTVVVPEGDVEKVDFLGATSNFANALLDQKPFGLAELSGTLRLGGDEILAGQTTEQLFFGAGTAISTTHTRYQAGKLDANGNFIRPEVAILVSLTDGTDEVNMVLDNALITKVGDVKLDGPDGTWEVDLTIKCLPQDFYMEWKD